MANAFAAFALLQLNSAAAGALAIRLRQSRSIVRLGHGLQPARHIAKKLPLCSLTTHVPAELQCDVLVVCDPRDPPDESP